ncbi:MAG: 30S ribosomal protein S8 [Ignavibacteria bacterium RIFOXYB2_FULL_35_12]|nr:MAG: 30S ribosomal protein S8 [Ignavibacteria bacterium GWA2_36_19]OGU51703.1 MAG: 30S ribosomal protein S8 [Ignavibacteria bacterium GWC2_35_8]OGU59927.1 MAG: 30S ribosomal protein S8 [Ignavibacteria bacterium GWF2_35_20]OGU80145.1 MAG: 30S ribosomal protein S8 [Ignavibacteria bacterium RIFOXYA2_FULL_35_9]OGU85369.1 MAG: 30S ribosomal protein S8 [Ignavibacteria bacterium RIFOXYA12_FULL_35_25]OGU89254.1 MAG: 30S ribosomal protein S8 [Ignavibacteria bacterium RIFOXYC12_FULL_35_11]OGU93396.1
MRVTDPISDFLTRIRNAVKARKVVVEIPSSKMKLGLAEILKKNNFIDDFSVTEDSKQNVLRIHLRYQKGSPAISGLQRISSPGLKVYKKNSELPRVLNGLGIAIISTPKGLLTDKEARSKSLGGEVVCFIW